MGKEKYSILSLLPQSLPAGLRSISTLSWIVDHSHPTMSKKEKTLRNKDYYAYAAKGSSRNEEN